MKKIILASALLLNTIHSCAMEHAEENDLKMVQSLVKLCCTALSKGPLAHMAIDPKIEKHTEQIPALRIPRNLQRLIMTSEEYTAKSYLECIDIHQKEPLLAYVEQKRIGYPYLLKFADISDIDNIIWLENADVQLSNKPKSIAWASVGRHIALYIPEDQKCLVVTLDEQTKKSECKTTIEKIIDTNADAFSWAPDGNCLALYFTEGSPLFTISKWQHDSELYTINNDTEIKQLIWGKNSNQICTLSADLKMKTFDLKKNKAKISSVDPLKMSRLHNGKIATIFEFGKSNMIGFARQIFPIFTDYQVEHLTCNPQQYIPAWVDNKQNINYMANHDYSKGIITTIHTPQSIGIKIKKLKWDPTGTALAAVNEEGTVHYTEIAQSGLFTPREKSNGENCIAWHPEGTHFFMARENELHILPLYKSLSKEEETLTLAQAALICAATQEKKAIALCEHNQEPRHLWEIYTQTEWPPKIKKYLKCYMKKECKSCVQNDNLSLQS